MVIRGSHQLIHIDTLDHQNADRKIDVRLRRQPFLVADTLAVERECGAREVNARPGTKNSAIIYFILLLNEALEKAR